MKHAYEILTTAVSQKYVSAAPVMSFKTTQFSSLKQPLLLSTNQIVIINSVSVPDHIQAQCNGT